MPEVEAHIHAPIRIGNLISALGTNWPNVRSGARPLVVGMRNAIRSGGTVRLFTYGTAEELLQHATTATDFWILELAEHFRLYDVGRFPYFGGLQYLNGVLGYAAIDQRASGHVTASFAEAICPWLLERLGWARPGDVFRIRRLEPSDLRLVADFVFYRPDKTLDTCEVKSAWKLRYVSSRGLQAGVTQVAVAMKAMNLRTGHLMVGIGAPASGRRYRADIMEFVA